MKAFPIPLKDPKGAALHYDRLSLSPDGRILAVTHGSTLQWLDVETGKVLDTADKAHEGMDCMAKHKIICLLKTFLPCSLPLKWVRLFYLIFQYGNVLCFKKRYSVQAKLMGTIMLEKERWKEFGNMILHFTCRFKEKLSHQT